MNAWRRALRGGRHDWRLQLSCIFSVAIAFVCLASALLLAANVQDLSRRWSHNGRASIYLKPDISGDDLAALTHALEKTHGVVQVDHVSSEAAREQLLKSGDEILAALPAEAFPASLEVRVEDPNHSGALASMAEKLRFLPKVESVETYEAWGKKLAGLLHSALVAAGILAVVVLATVISVVGSTIRLSLQRRRIEVQVLKLVGATDDYVRRPFLIEGAAQGALGATLALGVVVILFLAAHARFDSEFSLLLGGPPCFLPWYATLGLLGLGAVLGALSAHLNLRKLLIA